MNGRSANSSKAKCGGMWVIARTSGLVSVRPVADAVVPGCKCYRAATPSRWLVREHGVTEPPILRMATRNARGRRDKMGRRQALGQFATSQICLETDSSDVGSASFRHFQPRRCEFHLRDSGADRMECLRGPSVGSSRARIHKSGARRLYLAAVLMPRSRLIGAIGA